VDEFRAAQESLKGPGMPGWWDRVLPQLDAGQLERLQAAAADSTISHRAIAVVLGQWGHDVNVAKVSHWRRNRV
jgi:hypothetical protein